MTRIAGIGLALPFLLALASPAVAQDASEDWDLSSDPALQLTLASLDFGAHALALRCKDGVLDFLLTGVPATAVESRTVQVTAGGIAGENQTWQTQPGLPVLSASEPDRLARQLRAGGELNLRIEPAQAGDRPQRFRLTVPPSAAALDQTLSACGASLADEWDLLPRAEGNVTWVEAPRADYPGAAVERQIEMASVKMACIVPADGRLRECRALYESPEGLGFGRSALAGARNARVATPEGDVSDVGKVVQFTMRFVLPTS